MTTPVIPGIVRDLTPTILANGYVKYVMSMVNREFRLYCLSFINPKTTHEIMCKNEDLLGILYNKQYVLEISEIAGKIGTLELVKWLDARKRLNAYYGMKGVCTSGNLEVFDYLIVDCTIPLYSLPEMASIACKHGHYDIVLWFINKGCIDGACIHNIFASGNVELTLMYETHPRAPVENPLAYICRGGNIQLIKHFSHKRVNGYNYVAETCRSKKLDAVIYVIEQIYETLDMVHIHAALIVAVDSNSLDIVKHLFEYNTGNTVGILCYALQLSRADIINFLMPYVSTTQLSLFEAACEYGDTEIIKRYIMPNAKGIINYCRNSKLEISTIKILLDYGRCDLEDINDATFYLCKNNTTSTPMIQLMLDAGANDFGRFIKSAVTGERFDILEVLLPYAKKLRNDHVVTGPITHL